MLGVSCKLQKNYSASDGRFYMKLNPEHEAKLCKSNHLRIKNYEHRQSEILRIYQDILVNKIMY